MVYKSNCEYSKCLVSSILVWERGNRPDKLMQQVIDSSVENIINAEEIFN